MTADDKRPPPSLETMQLLGVDLIDTFVGLSERHKVTRSVVADAAEGFCCGLAVGTGVTRAQYVEHCGKLYDSIANNLPKLTVGKS